MNRDFARAEADLAFDPIPAELGERRAAALVLAAGVLATVVVACTSGAGSVEVRVADPGGRPLEGTVIGPSPLLFSATSTEGRRTDSNGLYEGELSAGPYQITAFHEGYESGSSFVLVAAGTTAEVHVVLRPASGHETSTP